MEEWALRGLIAIVAAAVGAVLRPWIAQRLTKSAVRGREQREMMEAWLAMTRQKWAHFMAAIVQIRDGKSVQEAATNSIGALKNWMDGNETVTRYPWEAERVLDKRLRALFQDLTDVMNHMLTYTLEAAKNDGDRESFFATINKDIKGAEALRKAIIEQMAKADL